VRTDTCLAQNEINALGALFNDWQNGLDITTCMTYFGEYEAAWNNGHQGVMLNSGGIPNDLQWELSGCCDLKTSDREP
jgi:hypothetical protein